MIHAILYCIFIKQSSHEDNLALSTYAYQSNRTNQSQGNSQKPQFCFFFLHKYAHYAKLTMPNMTDDITKSMRPIGTI